MAYYQGYGGGGYGGGYDPHAYGGGYQGYGGGVDEIRTLFITGFPEDIKERELNNLLRFVPGYVASQMNWKNGQAHGFALFDSAASCSSASGLIAGVQFDETAVLRCEIARKNMFAKDDPIVPGGVKRQRFNAGGYGPGGDGYGGGGGYGGNGGGLGSSGTTFSILTADDGPVQPVQPVAYQPVTNLCDNPPCSTLFVGNLGDNVNEQELRGLFGSQPGFKQLKIVRSARSTTGFVEYESVDTAMAVHQSLQGAVLPSSDRGGIRIQYSKNPFGRRVGPGV